MAPVERLKPFDVVCVMRERTRFSRSILEQLPNLKLLASAGRRNPAIDQDAAQQRGITVCSTGDSFHGAVELTWALILAIVRSGIEVDQVDLVPRRHLTWPPG
jgi:lactate dehydrogenase-like 2-hydroxyacid dehydrogenase